MVPCVSEMTPLWKARAAEVGGRGGGGDEGGMWVAEGVRFPFACFLRWEGGMAFRAARVGRERRMGFGESEGGGGETCLGGECTGEGFLGGGEGEGDRLRGGGEGVGGGGGVGVRGGGDGEGVGTGE